MAALIGLFVALALVIFARVARFDRDRAFYPTVLIVVAHYYVLFAAVGAKHDGLIGQLIVFGLFAIVGVMGFRISLWFVVAGLALHGLFDFAHQFFAAHSAVPQSWPSFCLAFDLAAAMALAFLLISDRRRPSGQQI